MRLISGKKESREMHRAETAHIYVFFFSNRLCALRCYYIFYWICAVYALHIVVLNASPTCLPGNLASGDL